MLNDISYKESSHFFPLYTHRITWDEVYECGSGLHCSVMDYEGIKNLRIGNMMWDVLALAVMLLLYRVLAYLALRNL